jgi:phosphoribosyl-AMP cyclohydrolase
MMKKVSKAIVALLLAGMSFTVWAEQSATERVPYFSNDQVKVWKTTIYPSTQQVLKLHRHDSNRVVVALTDGLLKITNDQGVSHLFTMEKEMAYYLSKDKPGEMHTDENISGHVIKVVVVEINSVARM